VIVSGGYGLYVMMTLMISGLDLLFLEVNSLEESLAFYEGVLGMEVESVNNDSEPPMAKASRRRVANHPRATSRNDVTTRRGVTSSSVLQTSISFTTL
jgi:hypothetical protein